MKKLLLLILTSACIAGYAQTDTISNNIYQYGGNLGIGTSYPLAPLDIIGDESMNDVLSIKNNNYARYAAYSFSDIWYENSVFAGFRARGSINEPQNIGAQDRITGLYGCMYIDGEYHTYSAVEMFAGNFISNESAPAYIIFGTTPNGSLQRVERMRIAPDGNIGIGTNDPDYSLDVAGDINFSGNLYQNGLLFSGGTNGWIVNGNDMYSSVSGNVSIGTEFPEHKFEVFDNNSHLLFNEGYSPTWQSHRAGLGIGYIGDGHACLFIDGVDGDFSGMDYASLIQFNDLSLELSNRSNSQINFGVGGDYFSQEHIKMSILHTGNVGIGTTEPAAKLQIADGDIFISDIDRGILMKSPDGQCWRGTLDNMGILNFEPINCPEIYVSKDELNNPGINYTIFPNPSDGKVVLSINNPPSGKLRYTIFNSVGQVVGNGKVKSNNQEIDISGFQAGIYVLTVNDKSGVEIISEKIIKQ